MRGKTILTFLLFTVCVGQTGAQDADPVNTTEGGETMNIPIRAAVAGALYIPIMVGGYLLSHSGVPYNPFLSVLHKLTAAGNIVWLNLTAGQFAKKIAPLNGGEIAALVVMDICFAAVIATGALLSGDKPMPAAVQWVHKIGPWAAFAASGLLLYSLAKN